MLSRAITSYLLIEFIEVICKYGGNIYFLLVVITSEF